MRKAHLNLYQEEIETLYATIESTVSSKNVEPPKEWTHAETEKWLKQQVKDVLPGKPFSVSEDLFEQGVDSFSSTILRRRIVGALQVDRNSQFSPKVAQNY